MSFQEDVVITCKGSGKVLFRCMNLKALDWMLDNIVFAQSNLIDDTTMLVDADQAPAIVGAMIDAGFVTRNFSRSTHWDTSSSISGINRF